MLIVLLKELMTASIGTKRILIYNMAVCGLLLITFNTEYTKKGRRKIQYLASLGFLTDTPLNIQK